MPNNKSAEKRMRQTQTRTAINRDVKGQIMSVRRVLTAAIKNGDRDVSDKTFRAYCSALDKAVKKGVVKANSSDRRKQRAAASIVRAFA